jgi:hypothetical protein
MLKAGIVEPSDSPYAAPIVLIKKKDQSLRICLDFRDLNKQTISESCFLSSDVSSGDIWTSSTLSFLCNTGEIAGFISLSSVPSSVLRPEITFKHAAIYHMHLETKSRKRLTIC